MINIECFDIQAENTVKTIDSNTSKSQKLSIYNNLIESKTNTQDIQNQFLSNSYDERNSIQQQQEEMSSLLQNEDETIQKKNKQKQVESLNTSFASVKKDNLITPQDSNDCQVSYDFEDIENETSQYIKCENKSNDNNKINDEEKDLRRKIDEIFRKAKNSKNFDSWKYTVYNELFKKSYVIESYINSGGQACVFDGYFLNDKGIKTSCAFKIYFQVSNKEFQKEIGIMKSFENPINIIKVIDSFQIGSQFILVLEKCEKSLHDELKQIKESKVKFSTDKLLQMIFDLLDGLIQFRIYNILHLDIKPGNVLISKDGNYCYSDFGTSFNKKQNEEIEVEFYTKKYAAPEMENVKSIDYQADVYSLGITFQVILDIFKKENLSCKKNNHNIKDFITDLEEIIKNNMILQKSSERLQCQKLHELILQKVFAKIKSTQMSQFNQKYILKVFNILQLYPYSQNKDIPYLLQMKIFYQQIHMNLFKNLDINQDFQDYIEDFKEFQSQNNKERDFDLFEYLGINESINKNDILKDFKQKGLANNDLESEFNVSKYDDLEKQIKNNPDISEDFKLNALVNMTKDFYIMKQINEGYILRNLGKNYFDLGEYKNALKYSLQSLELNKQIHEGNHKEIAFNLTIVSSCYQKIGDNEIGLEYQLESLQMRQQLFKGNNEDIAESLNNVGNTYMNIGDIQTGLTYLLQSLEIRQQIFLTDDFRIAIVLGNIGQAYKDLCDYQNSLNYSLKSLLMFKQVLRGNHPDIGTCLSNVGECYIHIGNIEKAMKYQEKSLKLKKEVFQGCHPDLATSLNNIGVTFMSNNDFVNGLKYSLQALEMRKQIFQGIHPDIPVSLNNVALCYKQLGDKKNGLKYLLESLQMLKLIYKGNHPNVATALFNFGSYYIEIGDHQNGLKYFQEFFKMNQGEKSKTADSLYLVGQCYYKNGDYQNSLKYHLEFHKINKQIYQGKHPKIAESMHQVGISYYYLGDFNNSWNYLISSKDMDKQFVKGFNQNYVECLQILSAISKNFFKDLQNSLIYALEIVQYFKQYNYDQQDANVATWLNNTAHIYIDLGDYKSGLKYSLEGLDMRKIIFKGNHPQIANSLYNVSVCYENLGLYNQYIKYQTRYVQMESQIKTYN